MVVKKQHFLFLLLFVQKKPFDYPDNYDTIKVCAAFRQLGEIDDRFL